MKQLYVLFAACLVAAMAQGQNVPNADFESWTANPYEEPQSWTSTNEQFGSLPGGIGISKSTDAHSGTYAAQVSTVTIGAQSTPYTAILTNGSFTNGGGGVTGGSPTTVLPDTLFFYYKFSTTASAKGRVLAYFFKYNGTSRDTVGFGQLSLDTTSSYTKAGVAIGIRDTLHHTNIATDSVLLIFLSSEEPSHPEQGTLLVDDIAFGNAYVGINDKKAEEPQLSIYPNPTIDEVQIKLSNTAETIKTINVYSIDGKLILKTNATGSQTTINTTGWAKSNYMLQIETSKGTIINRQIAKQ